MTASESLMTDPIEFDVAAADLRRALTAATRAFIAAAVHEALAPEAGTLRAELTALRQQLGELYVLRTQLSETQQQLEQLAAQVTDLAASIVRLEIKVDRDFTAETQNAALREALKQQPHWPWQRQTNQHKPIAE